MTTRRAAIYARFSSDRQSDRSIDDQVRLCRDHAAGLGLEVVEVFTDYALSGAHAASRPALQRLLAGARGAGGPAPFEVVIAEALDRLSRDQEDIAGLFKRLAFAGVAIVTVAEGEVGPLHIGLKGTMNALFLDDLARKIRRGQAGRVRAGRNPGGLGYGYAVERALGDDGEVERGRVRIDPAEAAVVRRIFADHAAGLSPRAIAGALNRESVPGPRGRSWNASTINGSRQRGNGILHNAAYAGRRVWNRVHMVKDPETGRRLSRPNPPGDWIVAEAPELRIVDDATWQHAQARREASPYPAHKARRPRRLLSGLLKCGICGGGYTLIAAGAYGCSAHRERGNCDNARRVKADRVEAAVLEGVKAELLSGERVQRFVDKVARELAARRQAQAGRRDRDAALTAQLRRQITRIVEAIAEAGHSRAILDQLAGLERHLEEVEARQAADDADAKTGARIVDFHPAIADGYRKQVEDLGRALSDDPHAQAQAATILRALIGEVILRPGPKRGEVWAEIQAAPAGIVALIEGRDPGADARIKVVAEEGLEPPTRGL